MQSVVCKGDYRDNHLDAKVTSVDIVTEEQVSGISRASANFKQFHEVILPSFVNSQRRIKRTRPRTYCPWISPQTRRMISARVEAKKGPTDL